jgi:hypothetical protein
VSRPWGAVGLGSLLPFDTNWLSSSKAMWGIG